MKTSHFVVSADETQKLSITFCSIRASFSNRYKHLGKKAEENIFEIGSDELFGCFTWKRDDINPISRKQKKLSSTFLPLFQRT